MEGRPQDRAVSFKQRRSLWFAVHLLAMDAGITGTVVAASLGHEHVSTTTRSYAKGEAVAGAQQRRALTVLAGGLG